MVPFLFIAFTSGIGHLFFQSWVGGFTTGVGIILFGSLLLKD